MSALRAITLSVESINSLIRTQYTIVRSRQLAQQMDLDEALSAVDPFLTDNDDPDGE